MQDRPHYARALYVYLNLVTAANLGHSENDVVVLSHEFLFFPLVTFARWTTLIWSTGEKCCLLADWTWILTITAGRIHHLEERTTHYSVTRCGEIKINWEYGLLSFSKKSTTLGSSPGNWNTSPSCWRGWCPHWCSACLCAWLEEPAVLDVVFQSCHYACNITFGAWCWQRELYSRLWCCIVCNIWKCVGYYQVLGGHPIRGK